MKLNRRNFFKNSAMSIFSVAVFSKATGLLNKAWAFVRDDSAVNKQGYLHAWDAEKADDKSKKKHGKHVEKINKEVAKHKGAKLPEGYSPMCANCTQYKKAEKDGYGTCAMVLATGKKDGRFVYKTGWCRVWAIKKSKVKSALGV
ncbi:MAG: hypothetical protein DRQ88_05565 [Epsilonproteobacteria bacterium]|nr:MAG: hypothetical protein DRQ89_09750 [Campylobacterota bacterium]RLA66784.1 MAG: hypothetical protein DRQ88_05565 [Campylobacterota bacterium]